jgi:hypothetical protein
MSQPTSQPTSAWPCVVGRASERARSTGGVEWGAAVVVAALAAKCPIDAPQAEWVFGTWYHSFPCPLPALLQWSTQSIALSRTCALLCE